LRRPWWAAKPPDSHGRLCQPETRDDETRSCRRFELSALGPSGCTRSAATAQRTCAESAANESPGLPYPKLDAGRGDCRSSAIRQTAIASAQSQQRLSGPIPRLSNCDESVRLCPASADDKVGYE